MQVDPRSLTEENAAVTRATAHSAATFSMANSRKCSPCPGKAERSVSFVSM